MSEMVNRHFVRLPPFTSGKFQPDSISSHSFTRRFERHHREAIGLTKQTGERTAKGMTDDPDLSGGIEGSNVVVKV